MINTCYRLDEYLHKKILLIIKVDDNLYRSDLVAMLQYRSDLAAMLQYRLDLAASYATAAW